VSAFDACGCQAADIPPDLPGASLRSVRSGAVTARVGASCDSASPSDAGATAGSPIGVSAGALKLVAGSTGRSTSATWVRNSSGARTMPCPRK